MSAIKDQSLDVTPQRDRRPREASTGMDSSTGASQSLFAPTAEREGVLPPSNGVPSAARAADLLTASTAMTDVVARAQMSIALQRNVGNARMGAMLQTAAEPQLPSPVAPPVALPAMESNRPSSLPSPAPAQPVVPAPSPVAPEPAKQATPTAEPIKPIASIAPASTTPPPAKAAPAPTLSAPISPAPTSPPVAQTVPSALTPAKLQEPPVSAKKEVTGTAATEKTPESGSEESAKPAEAAPPAKKGSTARAAKPGEKAEAGKAQTASPEGAAEEGGTSAGRGEGGRSVQLKMPEPPSDLTPAARQRVQKVKASAGQAAASHAALPSAPESVKQARTAVTEPQQEANAHAGADLVDALGQRPKPSPQIEAICAEIQLVIEEKRPPDEKSLVKADPEQMGQEAGDKVKGNVQGDVKRVDQSYDSLEETPTDTPQQGQPLEAPPASAPVPAMNASQAAPDTVPAQNVSLDQDSEDAKARMDEAGMNKEPAKLVQTGPVAEARQAQGELEQTAAEDPAKVLAAQQASLSKASVDMAALQQQALNALATSRSKTVSGTTGQQNQMVGSEEQKRTQVSAQAQAIFTDAQTRVNGLLQTLPQTAMEKWDAGITVAKRQFKEELKTVEEWIKKRHEDVLLRFADWLTGLPSWVTSKYNIAEKKFGDDVCNLAREISIEVNGIIMSCEAIIADARTQIANLFASLPASLQAWAAGEQAKLGAQLDTLQNHAHEVRDNFDRDLAGRAAQTVQEVREEIHALREKAKGFLGRLADAIDRFAQDPAKFILEGLLELLGIPPAAFWAVVAKIQKVIGDIADDPEKFANNLMDAIGKGFTQFFDNIADHLLHGFLDWLTGGLAAAGVTLPKDLSLKSIITFILELMGITWPRIRKLLANHIGEENVALIEKAYSIVANLVAMGPEGIFEMIKEKLNPQEILDQIIKAAVDYMMNAIIKAVSARILLLFNPVGAILQALEAIYRVLKWIFTNAARIFRLIETIVNGIADIIAGNIGGMANAVEKALTGLIAPVIDFLADYLGFGDLPNKVKETIISFQAFIEVILDEVIGWLVEKGKALLKAVGLGGEEDEEDKEKKASGDEEVGMTVTFSAAGKDHKLWIEVGAAGAQAQVASDTPESVTDKLVRWESNLAGDEGKENKRKDEALNAIEMAKVELGITEQKAQEALPLKEEAKRNVEDAEAGEKFQKADDETEDAERTLGDYLRTLFEIFGETASILVLLDKKLVSRGKNGDPPTDDVETEEAEKVLSYGYALHTRKTPAARIHIQRNRKGAEFPEVHLDEDGKLKEGPSDPVSADDDEKIDNYNILLNLAKLNPLDRKDFPTADTYRDKARELIIEKIFESTPTMEKLVTYMRASKEAIPSEYNRLRGDIYDECVSKNPATKYERPGPQFLKKDYKDLKKERRQPDGISGNQLFEAKAHTDVGPSGEEKEQYEDYILIILDKFLDSGGKGPYETVNYVIMDPDAREKWEKDFTAAQVNILPSFD